MLTFRMMTLSFQLVLKLITSKNQEMRDITNRTNVLLPQSACLKKCLSHILV
jgi:hypothetical protein